MMIAILIIGHCIMGILAYRYIRKMVIKSFKKWTNGDRNLFLFISSIPILNIIALLAGVLIDLAIDNKESKW